MIQQLGNYFLQPMNLAVLSVLVVVILLYLLKPKPEKKVMPSIMFFQEDENPGKLRQGLRKILQNKFLFLHLLIVSLLAVSLADPYVNQETETEEVTIYLDSTANTAANFQDVKDYASQHLSERNNLVIAGAQTEVYTDISASEARQQIRNTASTEVYPSSENSLESASSLEGRLYIASNLADLTDTKAQQLIDTYSDRRSVDIYETDFENNWGITDYRLEGEQIELYVKNYGGEEIIGLNINDEEVQEFEASEGELTTIRTEIKRGRNNISLSQDGFSSDNSIYLRNPSSSHIEVEIEGEHPYMNEVINVLPNADIGSEDPDIKIASSIDRQDVEKVENGLTLIYMAEESTSSSQLPVKISQKSEGDIRINQPIRDRVYNAHYLQGSLEPGAKNLTTPDSAIVKIERGEGTIIQYNILDNSFSRSIVFPIFWQQVFQNTTEKLSIEEANKLTGQRAEGRLLTSQGYSDVNGKTYAVSTTGSFSPKNLETKDQNTGTTTEKKSISSALNIEIVLLLLIESVLLYRERVI
jgi:hypothetical protein